ncbi:L,D-transpeptidase family protein [Priestia megaterium]|nr:L,D-transpeptidase family protein [Priestia megaterium]
MAYKLKGDGLLTKTLSNIAIICFAFLLILGSLFLGIGKTEATSTTHLIVINKANNQLAYYKSSRLVKTFKVATGRTHSLTPEGKFKIVNKIVNRPYYKENIPGGDPRNPLGNRWLGINARGTNGTTYAIHGNNNPSSIGKYISSGCIRMYDHDVEWLFGQVPVGTSVVITTSSRSFDAIAAANGFKVSGGSTSPSTPATGNILKKGDRSSAVQDLQRKLTSIGYDTKGIDGIFGSNTDIAVRKFQKDHGLAVDGIVGPATYKALGGNTKPPAKPTPGKDSSLNTSQMLKQGSRGSAVQALQHKLTSIGYDTKGIDGIFGSNTATSVRKFQKDNRLTVDGIVGPATYKALGTK